MEKVKEFFRKHFNKKVILTYLYGSFASRFLGFIVGMWAVSLVGHFFEFPNFKNLWGLTSKKTLVSKETYENLKWVAQVVIGFFVFEVFHKSLFSKVTEHAPAYYKKGMEYLEEKGVTDKARVIKSQAIHQVKEKANQGKEKLRSLYNRNSSN
jgi:hypothetical protein